MDMVLHIVHIRIYGLQRVNEQTLLHILRMESTGLETEKNRFQQQDMGVLRTVNINAVGLLLGKELLILLHIQSMEYLGLD